MAELDGEELCLPSELLAAEDLFVDEKRVRSEGCDDSSMGDGGGGDWCFPSEFPYHWVDASDVDSPVDSVTATDGSGEDYTDALTLQMAHYFLRDEEKLVTPAPSGDGHEASLTVGSPESTLWPVVGNWEASSGETLVQLKLNEETTQKQQQQQNKKKLVGRGLLSPPSPKPCSSPLPAALNKNAAATGYYHPDPCTSQRRDMVEQIQQLKRQQLRELQVLAAWRRHNRVKGGGGLAGSRPGHALGTSWGAAPLPQEAGEGMRAVFLGGGSRRGSCGTGVFLPRRVGGPTELRKKPALSTVLLPVRVMQALNLNLDELGAAAQPRFPGGFVLDHEATITARSNNAALSQGRRSYRAPHPVPASHHHHEVCLPSEWTY